MIVLKYTNKNKCINLEDNSDYGMMKNLNNPYGYNFGRNYKKDSNYQKVHHTESFDAYKKK